MSYYIIFFWWLMGVVTCFVLYNAFLIWLWIKLVARGDVAIKDKDGTWLYANPPSDTVLK
jgi:hypothetical protein